jgi:hypothetical protein
MTIIVGEVKKLGFDDFGTFRPQIEGKFFAMTPEERGRIDGPQWWVSEFQTLKLKDMQARLAAPAGPALPPRPGSGALPPPVAGGGAPPLPPVDDATAQVRAAFQKAQKSQQSDDWTEYFRLDRLSKASAT